MTGVRAVATYLVGARLAIFFRLIGAIPPAGFVQIIGKSKGAKVLHEKGPRPSGQIFCL